MFLVLFFVGVGVQVTSDKANASEPPSWTNGASTILQSIPLAETPNTACSGYLQERVIVELDTLRSMCLYGDEHLTIGSSTKANGSRIGVVGLPYGHDMHILEGVCEGLPCQYSSDKDMLVSMEPVGQYGWGIVVFFHASQRIRQVPAIGGMKYVFDTTQPDYKVKNDVGRYLWTPTFDVSENGKWIVAELRDAGLVLINTDTFTARHIITAGYKYGYGMDPMEQLAVSNDGKSVALMGSNVGFSIIDVTAGCGQALIGDLSQMWTTVQCTSSDLDIGALFPNYYYAERPRFFGDGHQLEAIIHSYSEGTRRVTFLAHGATATHRLKLLALGDSFTSGEGETDTRYYEPGSDTEFDTCHVSTRSYPMLVANALGIANADAKTVACAGARVGDIVGSTNEYWGQGNRLGATGMKLSSSARAAAQEEALDNFQPGRSLQSTFIERYMPEMITVGVGGNDAGLMGKLQVCAVPGTCEWAIGDGPRKTADEIKRLYVSLGSLFVHIREKSAGAKVYVVGYPDIIEADGVCDPVTSLLLDHAERVFMVKSMQYLNQVIRAATQHAGFTYLDIEQSMEGKKLCSGLSSTAMNGVRLGNDIAVIDALPLLKIIGAGTFHPTPTGHALVAGTILAGHPGLREDSVCPVDQVNCLIGMSIEPPSYWGASSETDNQLAYAEDFAIPDGEVANRLTVELPDGALEPLSTVSVEIHSDPTALATLTVNDKGGLIGVVSVPDGIDIGYHTLHLLGVNREGESIDMYQFVTIGQTGKVLGASDVSVGGDSKGDISTKSSATLTPNLIHATSDGAPFLTPSTVAVLGAHDTASAAVNVRSSGSSLVQSSQRILKDLLLGNVIFVITIGTAVGTTLLLLLTLLVILLRRRWAKHGS